RHESISRFGNISRRQRLGATVCIAAALAEGRKISPGRVGSAPENLAHLLACSWTRSAFRSRCNLANRDNRASIWQRGGVSADCVRVPAAGDRNNDKSDASLRCGSRRRWETANRPRDSEFLAGSELIRCRRSQALDFWFQERAARLCRQPG